MFNHSFPFQTEKVTITTKKKIPEKTLFSISSYLKKLSSVLNHNIVDSDAYLFNESSPHTLLLTGNEFLLFLKLNLKLVQEHSQVFNPFTLDLTETSLEASINIGEDNSIVKLHDFSFNTAGVRTAYILDLLDHFLQKSGVTNFILKFKDNYVSRGDSKKISIDYGEDNLVIDLKDKVCSLFFNRDYKDSVEHSSSFLNEDTKLIPKYSIVCGSNLVQNQIFHHYAISNTLDSEFKFLVQNIKDTLYIVDTEDKLHTFEYIPIEVDFI